MDKIETMSPSPFSKSSSTTFADFDEPSLFSTPPNPPIFIWIFSFYMTCFPTLITLYVIHFPRFGLSFVVSQFVLGLVSHMLLITPHSYPFTLFIFFNSFLHQIKA